MEMAMEADIKLFEKTIGEIQKEMKEQSTLKQQLLSDYKDKIIEMKLQFQEEIIEHHSKNYEQISQQKEYIEILKKCTKHKDLDQKIDSRNLLKKLNGLRMQLKREVKYKEENLKTNFQLKDRRK